MRRNRLGCFTFSGLLATLITILAIAGVVYARGGRLYSSGPLNAQTGEMLGGVSSHAETGGQCEACHTAPWSSLSMAERCIACHGEIALQMQNILALHGSIYQGNPQLECRDCHPEHRGAEASLTDMEGGEFPHEFLGFSLNGHRRTVRNEAFTCTDCHQEDISVFATNSCDACHRQMDPVFAQAHTLSYGTACLDCHDGVDRFGQGFNHNVSQFKLVGGHQETACVQCHIDVRQLADFTTAPQDCFACHRTDDPHEARFGADCSACHLSESWEPATFDHNRSNFPLDGAHSTVDCEACHTSGQFAGPSTQCVACHADPDFHFGVFNTNCAECHSTTAWIPANFNLSHPEPRVDEEGTGINHGYTTCCTCHPSTVRSYTCLECHSDNQGGEGDEGDDD